MSLCTIQDQLPVSFICVLFNTLATSIDLLLLILHSIAVVSEYHQSIVFVAGVINHIIPAVYLACMGSTDVVAPDSQSVVSIGRFIFFPVRGFYKPTYFIK